MNENKKDFRILYFFIIIMSMILIGLYLLENEGNNKNISIQKIKENEVLKETIGRIPEFIESNDVKLQYNKTSKSYEPIKNNSIKKVN